MNEYNNMRHLAGKSNLIYQLFHHKRYHVLSLSYRSSSNQRQSVSVRNTKSFIPSNVSIVSGARLRHLQKHSWHFLVEQITKERSQREIKTFSILSNPFFEDSLLSEFLFGKEISALKLGHGNHDEAEGNFCCATTIFIMKM